MDYPHAGNTNWKTHSFHHLPALLAAPDRVAALYPHVASPDVLVREDLEQIVMYYPVVGWEDGYPRSSLE